MREVLSLHIGQAGIQTGTNCWELFCAEHGLDYAGLKSSKSQSDIDVASDHTHDSQSSVGDCQTCRKDEEELRGPGGFSSFFEEMSSGNYSPRAMFVDLEPTVIDQVRTGPYKGLFCSKQLINGKEDAANNYARGYYSVGGKMVEDTMFQLNKMVEACDKAQGFMVYHSFGGGTGSGFHSLMSQHIFDEYPKMSKLEIAVFPSPTMSTSVVEPYNAVLETHATLDNTDCVFLADNEAMYNICMKRLDVESPTYGNLNRLLAQTVSSITASLRFKGSLNADFIDFQTNLVPYPRIHFPVMSYAPIVPAHKVSHETFSVADLTAQAFDPLNRLARCQNEEASYIACCLLYRGDVAPKEVNAAIAALKHRKNINFVPWSPTGFKVGINSRTPTNPPGSDLGNLYKAVCMICNTTAIKEAWASINSKFAVMAHKRAFIHWYMAEGMEEDEFLSSQEDLLTLEVDYTHLEKD